MNDKAEELLMYLNSMNNLDQYRWPLSGMRMLRLELMSALESIKGDLALIRSAFSFEELRTEEYIHFVADRLSDVDDFEQQLTDMLEQIALCEEQIHIMIQMIAKGESNIYPQFIAAAEKFKLVLEDLAKNLSKASHFFGELRESVLEKRKEVDMEMNDLLNSSNEEFNDGGNDSVPF